MGGTRGAPPFLQQKEERAQRQMNKRGALNLQTKNNLSLVAVTKAHDKKWLLVTPRNQSFVAACDNKNLLVRMPVTETTLIHKVTQERLHH